MDKVTVISFFLLVTLTAKVVCTNTIPNINTSPVIYINEDTPVGGFAFQINATDMDNDPLVYGLSDPDSNYFLVNPGNGTVTVKTALDRETKEILSVYVTVTDNVYPTVSKILNIVLNDANDNFPIFQGAPYNIKLPENTTPGTSVLRVSATDADAGTAGTLGLTYVRSGSSPPDGMALFDINKNSGIITLTGDLSFTNKSTFYQLNITATDGGGPLGGEIIKQSRSTFVLVTVEDVPNLDPVFLNLPNTATVVEGSAVGTSVFTVRARDPDTGIQSPISYSIKSASVRDLFEINASTGIITVKATLDREEHLSSDGIISLEVEAMETIQNVDGINAAVTDEIQITIGDLNDERPEFYSCDSFKTCVLQNSFTGNIDEHSAVGLPVLGLNMEVTDKDKGDNSKFRLSLEGQKKDAFSVSPVLAISNANVQILMRNRAEVDYEETQSITLMVIAVDTNREEFQSTATVTITINDINDNVPKFQNETYDLEVEEHSPVGTVIANITASDPDTEDIGNLEYKLLPESITEFFNVDPKTGVITVQNSEKLDRERRSLFSATLQAKDTANNIGTAILEITLLDKNDNPPKMIRDSYIDSVNEGPGVTFELRIQATDDDQPGTDNSKIEYQIAPSDFSSNFTLDKDTGILTLAGPLDREALDPELKGVIELNVTAYDKGTPPLGTWVIVEINVGDINDNQPHFQKKLYDFTVKESEQGAFINSVFATDRDQTNQNNRISFRITGGGAGIFSVRSIEVPDKTGYWGNISVDQDNILDYETRKEYTITVDALDPEQLMDKATVHITVLDVNDETPTLPPGQVLSVKENSTLSGEVVGAIRGEDVDTMHKLEYKLLSTECPCNKSGVCQEEWFLVEPSGNVTVNPEYVLDYEVCDQVILHVQVTDVLTEMGTNSSEGIVTINIKDINDNVPEFIQVQPNFVVLAENTEADTSVAIVSATDRDSGENARMTFEVLKVNFIYSNNQTEDLRTIFRADNQPQTSSNRLAIIRSLQSLNANMKGKYVVEVQVANPTEVGGLNSTTEVVIFTVDKSFKIALDFKSTEEDLNKNIDTIKWALESATGTTVHIIKVKEKNEQRAAPLTVVEAYFIYPNGTALEYNTVINMVNGNPNTEFRDMLFQNGLIGVNPGTDDNQGEVKTEFFVLLGLVGGLAIVLIVMTTVLVFMRRNYQRKLKAAKAMNSATMVIADNQKSGPVVPGTNKYTMEGANPVLNLNIDTTTDLGFDEEDSNADRASLNSLDDMNIDMNMSDKDTVPMMVIEEEDEENGPDASYYEPLGAALAQRSKRRGANNSPPLTFDNPGLSTTDL